MATESPVAGGLVGPQNDASAENGESDQTDAMPNGNAAAHLPARRTNGSSSSSSSQIPTSRIVTAIGPLHVPKNGSKNYEHGSNGVNGVKRRRVDRERGPAEEAAPPPSKSQTKDSSSNPTSSATKDAPRSVVEPRDVSSRLGKQPTGEPNKDNQDLDKLIDTRRKYFHAHLHATNSNLPTQESANVPARLSNEASHKGRSLWCTNDASFATDTFQLLSELEQQATVENPFYSKNKQRQDFASRTVEELEETIKSEHYGNQPGVESLVLEFNECSSLLITKWVAKQVMPNSGVTASPQILPAAVNAKFRKCAICNKTGHYELECPKQQPQQTRRLLGLVDIKPEAKDAHRHEDRTIQNPPPPARRRANTKVDEDSDEVVLESCCGFMIEQQAYHPGEEMIQNTRNALKHSQDNSDPNVEVTDIDGFVIKATKEQRLQDAARPIVLKEGDMVAWFPSGEEDKFIHTGVALTACQSDNVKEVSVRCVSVIPRGPVKDGDRKGGPVGETLTVSRKKIMFLKDCVDKLPTINNSNNGAKKAPNAHEKRSEGSSKQRRPRL